MHSVRCDSYALVIGKKISVFQRQFSTNEKENQTIAPRACNFSRALSKLQVIPWNSDWFIALFAPIVIGGSK